MKYEPKVRDSRGVAVDLKPGGIIGFSGSRWWNHGINLFTFGLPWLGVSHIAILAEVNRDTTPVYAPWDVKTPPGELLLFESTANCNLPCYLTGKKVKGFQAHLPYDRIASAGGKIWYYPLKRGLRPLESARLTCFLSQQVGKVYDYEGAARAGGIVTSLLLSLIHDECLESLFCSETCAAAHRHVSLLRTGNVSRWSPNHFVRVEQRMGILDKRVRLK